MATKPKVLTQDEVYSIIDPNPENHTVEHEDLYIYASLKAKTKGRTFLTEDRTSNDNDEIDTIEISTVDLVIADSVTRGENKRQFLSTNWTEIGGSQFTDVNNRGDVEGFGITNVDIKVEGSYIPVVTIDFVDIRGATLFEQGSCSPYGLFFHLPYPVFELTVKGYYGKPVTYYLNLVKFNTKFNSETGNFEARGEFIGWSYAFLADVLMGFVRCANYMDEGWGAQKSLRNKYDEAIKYYIDNGLYDESDYLTEDMTDSVTIEGHEETQPFCWQSSPGFVRCMTITDLIKRIDKVEDFLGRVKTDDKYTELTGLIRVSNQLIEMRSALQNFNREITSEEWKGYLKEIQDTTATGVNERTKFIFNGAPDKNLKNLLRSYFQRPIAGAEGAGYGQITAQIPQIKQERVTAEDVFTNQYGGSFVGVGSQTELSPPNGIADVSSVSEEGSMESYEMFSILNNQDFQNKMMDNSVEDEDGDQLFNYTNAGGNEFFIDTGYISKIISDDLKIINEELERRRNSVKEEIDAGVVKRLGFRPTIRNVFTILSCNVENFVQLLLNCSIKAEEYHSQRKVDYNRDFSSRDRRLNEVRNSSGEATTGQNVYPWPTYYERTYTSNTSYSSKNKPETKEVYPGENPDFFDWYEVRFVEDFIKACEKVNKEDEALLEDKTGLPGYDNYTPINPLESKIIDADVQLKYREAATLLEESNIDELVRKYIAERMFITTDFSYYDPIRLNLLNFGMGHNVPKLASIKDNEEEDLGVFNRERLWFHTLYGDDKVIKTIAKIDANNLLSTIDDTSILSQLNLNVGLGDLKANIKDVLRTDTNNQESPNGDQAWFKTGVDYTDIFNHYQQGGTYQTDLRGVLNKNLNDIDGYNKDDQQQQYWAYHPKGGRIRFLGKGSLGFGNETDDRAVLIHTDIRKMREDYLFKLIKEEELDNIFEIKYKKDNEKRNEDLNDELSENILKKITSYFFAYNTEQKTKLLQFDGGDEKGKGLFTTLNVGISAYDNKQGTDPGTPYDIEYAAIPTILTNDDPSEYASSYIPGYGNLNGMLIPFMQQTYMAFGNRRTFNDFESNDAEPQGYTLELPGRGIFKGVTLYDVQDGDNSGSVTDGTNPNDLQEATDDTEKSGIDLLSRSVTNPDKIKFHWNTIIADTLVQLPIWLDNVNRFRYATTKWEGTVTRRDNNNYQGVNRPLTTEKYELKSPQGGQVIRTYGDNGKPFQDSSTESAYTPEQIQNRNLAYLFLASCKPTPFITAGASESKDEAQVWNDISDHYPKAIIPFITSQGLIKLPKVWVYGIGSVLWRWKMYMGCNTDSKGNILWRHPAFGDEPIGLDPLAQPGHPGVTQNFDTKAGARKTRNFTVDDSNFTSYTNRLFNQQKGWISSPITQQNHIQTSCFSYNALLDAGLRLALTGGRSVSDTPNGYSIPNNRIAHGAAFDYWGVYNADPYLSKKDENGDPGGIPNSIYMDRVWVGGGSNGNGNKFVTRSSWTKLYFSFFKGRPAYELGTFCGQWINPYISIPTPIPFITKKIIYQGNPLDISFRDANEASRHSFWPMLWITPWQHFYTEPTNSETLDNKTISPRLKVSDEDDNSFSEKTLTFIPFDHPYRDYVGNFGSLGNETGNYRERFYNPDSTLNSTTLSINQGFLNPNKEFDTTSKNFNTSYLTGLYGSKIYEINDWVNLEGGKYTELISLLPNFIKEKFVEEFENWVDGEWATNYLKVIDPVNFDDGDKDLLGKSYKVKTFGGTSNEYNLDQILGRQSATQYTDPFDFDADTDWGIGIIGLDKGENTDNTQTITDLEKNLFKSYYYAMISTPRVFGLDWHDYQEGTPFYANEKLVDAYLEAFQEEWKENYENTRNNIQENDEDTNNDTLLDDSDIKLSLYRSFKSITDKWISSTTDSKSVTPNYFFNITGNGLDEGKTPLAGHFSYVNRVMGEIGNRAVLDVIKLKEIKDNPKMSFYNLISDLLGENKFDFFPLPTFTNFTGGDYKNNPEKKAEDMFSPYTNMIDAKSGPNFICMYVGGTSRTLDLKPKANCPIDQNDMNYNDDGFSLSNSEDVVNIPHEYQNPEDALISPNRFGKENLDKRIENGGITAFRVAYGIENQNMFKSVELDQTEFSETNESLLVINRLANGGDPSNRTQKGNNLHNVYLTRSYTCKVESLGNMMIQPLQYFDLTNIPMFYGTYIITKVEHNIKPHHITTNFTGVRQPIATVPIVEDIAVALNNSIRNIEAVEGENVLGTGGAGGSGAGSSGSAGCGIPEVADSEIKNDTRSGVGTRSVNTDDVVIPQAVEEFFKTTNEIKGSGPKPTLTTAVGTVEADEVYRRMNEFLYDRIEAFAIFLNNHYPSLKGKIYFSSGIRTKTNRSQHNWGSAIDFGFVDSNIDDKLSKTHDLFNALMQFHRVNNYEWDQILFETRVPKSVWIHWSYSRDNRTHLNDSGNKNTGLYQNILRMYGNTPYPNINDKKVDGVPINNKSSDPTQTVSIAAKTYDRNETRSWNLDGTETRTLSAPSNCGGNSVGGSGATPSGQLQSGIPIGQGINGTVNTPNGVQGALQYAGQI